MDKKPEGVELDIFHSKEKNYHSNRLANGKIKEKILGPAPLELAEKTDIKFTYVKKLIKYIETSNLKADAVSVLKQVADATQGQQTIFIEQAFADYQFTEIQKNKIRQDNKFKLKFIEIHTLIMTKAIEVQTTPTRLMAWHLRKLGWN